VVERTHSTWFHFVKQPRYFAAVDEVREEHKDSPNAAESSVKRYERAREQQYRRANDGFVKSDAFTTTYGNPLGKLPGSVWTDLTWDQVVERIVKGWAPKDGALAIQGTDSLPLGVRT
jgi:hypothetical protein